MCKFMSKRLHATCGGGQTELRCGIHFDFSLSFYTAQYKPFLNLGGSAAGKNGAIVKTCACKALKIGGKVFPDASLPISVL